MSNHTPGPWRIERQNPSPTTGEWMIAGSAPGYLAEIRDCGSGDPSANARLIAAAPDLLEALEELLSMCQRQEGFHDDGDGCMFERASAAIAKARREK